MDKDTFDKRIYTLTTFINSVRDIFCHLDELRAASRAGRITPAFAEKIMLAVTQVNDCRYCAYGHTRAALAAGVSEAELHRIMAGELSKFPAEEIVALTFAQHYAESACQPAAEAWESLLNYYGQETARDIMAYLRMITFGNLFGNTFDALLSRLAGKPAAGSSMLGELGVILGSFVILPVELIRCMIVRYSTRAKRRESLTSYR